MSKPRLLLLLVLLVAAGLGFTLSRPGLPQLPPNHSGRQVITNLKPAFGVFGLDEMQVIVAFDPHQNNVTNFKRVSDAWLNRD